MSDRDDIIETITRLFWHTDHHNWDDVRAVFADQVRVDYTSLQGGEPATVAPTDLVGGWEAHFETVPAHQHLVTNHLVSRTDDAASVTAQFIASHQTGEEVWTLGGDYHFELTRDPQTWRITSMTMTAVWQQPGDLPKPPAG
ncbi:MAG: nuclear transport factor 2 family protein [Actinomycetota bacterium]